MIVVDTSVLIGLLRNRQTPAVARLERLEVDGTPFAIPVVCCQEVLQGARDEVEWSALRDNLATQVLLAPRDQWGIHVRAARLYFDCRRKGTTPRSAVDCLIAQMVLETGGTLLHDDDDFDRIAKVRPLRTMRC